MGVLRMFSLILAVVSSAAISVLMRFGEKKIQSRMGMFIANYAVCTILSGAFMSPRTLFAAAEGWPLVAALGAATGVLFLASFIFLQKNISRNGLSVSAVFMKLGIIVPTLMAMIVFHEQPRVTQAAGIVTAVAAVILITYEKGDREKEYRFPWLFILLLSNGMADAMANIFDKLGNSGLKDHYLLFTFLCALLGSVILFLRDRQRIAGTDILLGVCIGIPNYFSSRFLLDALREIPAMIVYPSFSVMTVVVITLAGVFLFGEKIGRRKALALLLILVALVLLNLGG